MHLRHYNTLRANPGPEVLPRPIDASPFFTERNHNLHSLVQEKPTQSKIISVFLTQSSGN